MATFREQSKGNWEGAGTLEHINAGSLQRIADATEKMASSYTELELNYKSMRESRDSWQKEAERLQRSNNALRGYLKRFKKK